MKCEKCGVEYDLSTADDDKKHEPRACRDELAIQLSQTKMRADAACEAIETLARVTDSLNAVKARHSITTEKDALARFAALEASLSESEERRVTQDQTQNAMRRALETELTATLAKLAECERERDELKVGRAKPTASELLQRGGEWLGAARSWMQWHRHNGDSVTWGSNEELRPPMTVRDVEDLAAEVASAAMRPQPIEERVEQCLRARWAAESQLRATAAKLASARTFLYEVCNSFPAHGDVDTWIENVRKGARVALASLDPPETKGEAAWVIEALSVPLGLSRDGSCKRWVTFTDSDLWRFATREAAQSEIRARGLADVAEARGHEWVGPPEAAEKREQKR